MKLPEWKTLRWALLASVVAGGAGCGGLNASHSISPASFFLPGLLKADPPKPPPEPSAPAAQAPKEIALLR
jgi:hypothetical protein